MKLVLKLTCLLYALLFFTMSFGQKKDYPGLYIASNGDTVQGNFIRYSQWDKSPSNAEFIASASPEQLILTPLNCRKFVIQGLDEYVSYIGERLTNPIDDYLVMNERYTNSNDQKQQVAVFLRLVTRTAGCELFVYTDARRSNFFYRLPGQPLVELRYKKYYDDKTVEVVSGSVIKESWEYKNQLANTFSKAIENARLASSLQTLVYRENALRRFFEKMFVVEKIKQQGRDAITGLIISAGTAINFITLKAERGFNAIATEYGSSISPLLSIGHMTAISRNFGKYFLYPKISLSRYRNTGEIDDGTLRKITTYQAGLIASGEVNIGVNIINRQDTRMYLSVGAGMMGIVKNKRREVAYLKIFSTTEPYQTTETAIPVNAAPVIIGSAGIVIKNKFLLSAAYQAQTTVDNVFRARYSGLQFTVGYKL